MECQILSKYPNVKPKLTGQNTNIYNLLGICVESARKAQVPKQDIDAFLLEVRQQKTYDEALETCARWFSVH
jgi:hypothetical protein